MIDLDNVLDPEPHDKYNREKQDDELVDIWVRRKLLGKKTWQVEREISNRKLMDRCLEKLSQVMSAGDRPKPVKKLKHGEDIFIVYGHDRLRLEQVARLVDKLGMNPVVMGDEPNLGRTLIEKLEQLSDVRFAIILLTPDDKGGTMNAEELNPRARQNVIMELGYFIGRIGRERTAVVYDESVEIPSDYHGVAYVHFDDKGMWKYKLGKEMQACGLPVDLNNI